MYNIYIYICVCMCVCVYVYVCMYVCVYMCCMLMRVLYVCVCVYVCVYVCMYVCVAHKQPAVQRVMPSFDAFLSQLRSKGYFKGGKTMAQQQQLEQKAKEKYDTYVKSRNANQEHKHV